MDDIVKYFPFGLFALQAFMGWFLWSMKREFVSQKDFSELKGRTQRVEDTVQNLPSVKSMHDLSLQLGKMAGDIQTLTEILGRVEKRSARQEEYLFMKGK